MTPAATRRPGVPTRGFTLVELLMVLALVAVTLLISIQFSRSMGPESSLDAAANEIASSIELARSEAVLHGRRVFMEFDLTENDQDVQAFRSIREPLPGHENDAEDDEYMLTVRGWRDLPKGVRIEAIVLGETEPFTEGGVQVAIQPDGTMPSHLIRLYVPEANPDRNRDYGWACIQVAGLLGQARVLNRYVEPEFLREDSFQ